MAGKGRPSASATARQAARCSSRVLETTFSHLHTHRPGCSIGSGPLGHTWHRVRSQKTTRPTRAAPRPAVSAHEYQAERLVGPHAVPTRSSGRQAKVERAVGSRHAAGVLHVSTAGTGSSGQAPPGSKCLMAARAACTRGSQPAPSPRQPLPPCEQLPPQPPPPSGRTHTHAPQPVLALHLELLIQGVHIQVCALARQPELDEALRWSAHAAGQWTESSKARSGEMWGRAGGGGSCGGSDVKLGSLAV